MGRVRKQAIVADTIADQFRPHAVFLQHGSVHHSECLNARAEEGGGAPLPGFKGKRIVGSYPQGFQTLQAVHRVFICGYNERKVRISLTAG
jgi:hypothetical protein